MAYGPGVNEINYSDLPPTGDTVNSAFQKTQNQFDALYTGLNGDIVRASEADVNTATDTTKLVTPGTLLKGKVNGVASLNSSGKVTETELPNASETVKGVVELATSAEVLAGTDTERAITPDTLTKKILGTVSEASGVPTGAVIERGSNANGSYVKFADGTVLMSCIMTALETNNGSTGTNFTLPTVLYTNIDTAATTSVNHTSGGLGGRIIEINKVSTTTFNAKVMTITSTGTLSGSTNTYLDIFVYGRWF